MGKLCRHFLITVTAAFVCLLAIEQVESTESFEVRLHRFVNPEGRDASGGCCGDGGVPTRRNDGNCPVGHGCPVFFRVCVNTYQTFVDSSSPCIIGEFLTRNFNDESLPNLLTEAPPIIFYLNFSWPGSFSFVVEAYHISKTTEERMLVSRFIAQRSLSPKLEWTVDNLTSNRTRIQLSYRVRCQTNYYGHRCATLCKPRNDKFGHYTCGNDGEKVCMLGWEGAYCSTAVCRPGCHIDHGFCEQPHDCLCRHGWEGELCDTCSRYPGCEHGTCTKSWECKCHEGWGGLFCNQDLNYCTNHRPCKNGGICTNTGQGSFTCRCSEEYIGKTCDVLRNPCKNNPCQNGGTCVNPSDGNYTCQCPLGFYGPTCETSANICTENPCKNGGSCIHDPGGFACACLPGFYGSHCEKSSLQCSPDSCRNNATCIEDKESFHCSCLPGYLGELCEKKVDLCMSNPCRNGGVCYYSVGSYECDCKSGFSGKNCSVQIDVPHQERTNHSTAISNISHQVSDEPKTESPTNKVAIILSSSVVAATAFIVCAICLAVKFFRHHREPKRYSEAKEDELKQNERNILHMNNNCNLSSQKKTVNTLDRIPGKVNNEVSSKVVNTQVCRKKLPEKNLIFIQKTLERRESTSGSGNSSCHSSQDWSGCSTGSVFIIQDHIRQLPQQKVDGCYQSRPPSLQIVEEDVFATEV